MGKSGIPAFLLDTSLDEKWELLEARFGLKGFAIAIKLLQRIYGGEGYYCEWNDDIGLVFAKNAGADASLVSDIVEFMVRRGLFDLEKFSSLGILTSAAIQKNYLAARRRATEVILEGSFLCIHFSENGYKNVKIVYRNGKNVYKNPTSKEKVNISKEKKEEKRKEEKPQRFTKPTCDQVREYMEQLGYAMDPQQFLDYYESKGWKVGQSGMKDWKAAVRTWQRRDQQKQRGDQRKTRAAVLPRYAEEKTKPEELSQEQMEALRQRLQRLEDPDNGKT